MSQPIRHYPCPACGAALKMQASHQTHTALKEQYADCANPFCGATVLIRSEVVKIVSPPADLFAKNVRFLPVCDNPIDRMLDMAREFVARPWQGDMSRDGRLDACREYLQAHLDIGWREAELTAARAIAEHESRHLPGWCLDIDVSSSACAIVNDGQGNQYAISLRELVDFVLARRKAAEGALL